MAHKQQFRQRQLQLNSTTIQVILQNQKAKHAQQAQENKSVDSEKKRKEIIPQPERIYSLGFAQQLRSLVLLNKATQTDCEIKKQHLQRLIKYEEISSQPRFDKNFSRNRVSQRCAQEYREKSNERKFVEWPKIGQSQVFAIGLPRRDKRLKVGSQDLLDLKCRKHIPKSIVSNFFSLLQQSGKIHESIAIIGFNFLPTLLEGVAEDEQNQQNIIQAVKNNYHKASKCLSVPLLQKAITVVPFIVYDQYFMVIIKATPKFLAKKEQKIVLVYCSSRFTADKSIFVALKTYVEMEIDMTYGKGGKMIEKNLQCTQLILPKQIYSADSGLFLMLYSQYLLADGGRELDDVKANYFGPKLHLFPLNLVEEMRAILWNFYYKLIHAKEKDKQGIIEEYFEERRGCVARADLEKDYCDFEAMEVKKLQSLMNGGLCWNEEERFFLTLECFYSASLNYYVDE